MLDEEEFEPIGKLLVLGMQNHRDRRRAEGVSWLQASCQEALDAYALFTGFVETNPNALWHHRLSLYGPPCPECGRPKRTRRASRFVDCEHG